MAMGVNWVGRKVVLQLKILSHITHEEDGESGAAAFACDAACLQGHHAAGAWRAGCSAADTAVAATEITIADKSSVGTVSTTIPTSGEEVVVNGQDGDSRMSITHEANALTVKAVRGAAPQQSTLDAGPHTRRSSRRCCPTIRAPRTTGGR